VHWEDKGGSVISLSFPPLSDDLDLGGCPPPPFHCSSKGASGLFPLSPGLHFLIGGMLHLLPCRILR
jgi:hypothetical protein